MKRYPVIHPFLFAMYPVLAVLAASLALLNPVQAIRPMIIILLVCGIIFLILHWIYKDWYRAGFIASMVIIMLFYYGYSYRLPREIHIFDLAISRHLIIIIFWVVFLGILASKWLWQRVRPHVITSFLNISSGLALLYAIYLLGAFWYGSRQDPLVNWSRPPNLSEDSIQLAETYRPDIYYIILDGYARADILQEIYNHDNSDFIDALKSRGFYIADQSYSNYTVTPISLASSMNFEYLDYLSFAGGLSKNSYPLGNLIVNSRVRTFLEKAGYHIYLSGEFLFAELSNPVIVFYSPQIRKLTTFESLLLESTMFEILIDLGKVKISTYTYESQRERILNGFAESEYLVNKKAPKFVFLHIIAPHPPFVFDKNGNPVQPDWEYNIFDGRQFFGGLEEYKEGYIKQMMYVNSLILKTIDQIMKYSSSPPIIVLQADHGSGALLGSSIETSCLKERFSILNAYYFPDGNTSRLYSSISPVNTFRVIFDTYFRTNLALLPDLYYFSDHDDPYQYDAVTDQVDTPCHLSELP